MPVPGQAADEVFDFLVNLLQFIEDFFGKLLNGLAPAWFAHADSMGTVFKKLCARSVRSANSCASRAPLAVGE